MSFTIRGRVSSGGEGLPGLVVRVFLDENPGGSRTIRVEIPA